MTSISRGCLSGLALLLLLVGVAPLHASAQFPAPQPGEVYKEFTNVMTTGSGTWRVTDPDAAAVGVPGNSPADFLPNSVVPITIGDLQNATRAELVIDHWGGHVGTAGKKFRFNGNAFIDIPQLTSTPTDGQCYMQQWNVVVPVPLSQLNQGGNTLEGIADRQTCHQFDWGQWGWYQVMVRVYYNPNTKAHPTGSISSHTNGAILGENPTVATEVTSGAGVSQVQFLAYYDGIDEDGDGVFLDYHRAYHRGRLDTNMEISGHVGTATGAAPYQVIWDTDLVPDQGSIKLLARIQDNNGIWFVTDEVTDLTLQRPDTVVRYYKPENVQEAFWVNGNRGDTLNHNVTIPAADNLANAIEAKLVLATWNGISAAAEPGENHYTRVNAYTIPSVYGDNHYYSFDVIDVPPASLLSGTNSIILHAESTHHGIELMWPGAGLVVRYSVPPSTDCGNGLPNPGEQCDDGNNINNDGCSAACVLEFCGDGIVQSGIGEECDDGNLIDGDGCQSDCQRQGFLAFGFEGTGGTVIDLTGSGNNGTLQSGGLRTNSGFFGKAVEFSGAGGNVGLGPIDVSGFEATWSMWFKADDFDISDARLISKATSNDAQDHFWMVSTLGDKLRCRVRTEAGGGNTVSVIGPAGTLSPGVWTHVACVYDGNQIRLYQDGALIKTGSQSGQLAEDNTVGSRIGDQPFGGKNFDGIIDEVRIDLRALSQGEIALDMITPLDLCGDGLLQPGEECDDGNLANNDLCSEDCDIERCGDGILHPLLGEVCDDGNLVNGDGCQDTCQLPFCGDGWADPGEQCDDGNAGVGDGCTPACILEFCGDGMVQPGIGEQCDNGLANSDAIPNVCRTTCLFAHCGDGVLDAGEACDDGNLTGGDGCQPTCLTPVCGDGFVDAGEGCDDGNTTDGDGCTSICQLPFCGDGITDPGEECDAGVGNSDTNSGACRTDCTAAACADGIVDPGEQCDDGNTTSNDGCRADCTQEVCGDGIQDADEDCDDGNHTAGDGCAPDCTSEICGDGVVQAAAGEQCDSGPANSDTQPNACRTTCRFPDCGDSVVDAGEQCDDGNTNSGDGCQGNCQLPICGDNIVDDGEQCDDGNVSNGDGCSATCQFATCGDAILDASEDCDQGVLNSDTIPDRCRTDCTDPACGDGTVDTGEQCDDNNLVGGDGCQGNCLLPVCGDGTVDPGEQCDDGNGVNGDGCSACQLPSCGDGILDPTEECDQGGLNSDTIADRCRTDCASPRCGDGALDTGEQCDDGNGAPGDGCRANCTPEVCGDGLTDPGEACDDGNKIGGDGCASNCSTAIELYLDRTPVPGSQLVTLDWSGGDPNYDVQRSIDPLVLVTIHNTPVRTFDDTPPMTALTFYQIVGQCGNGVINAGEECDDGNNFNGDGCQSNCRDPFCGDGTLDQLEQCDDGNNLNGDGCSAFCVLPFCGDGNVDPGEQCDDGNTVTGDACSACSLPFCGDGFLGGGEECDDGNNVNGDGCQANCVEPFCGDGILDAIEECDDGNNLDADGCSALCLVPFCGDGITDAGEQCDDGNDVNGDSCTDCKLPSCGDGYVDGGEECDDGNNVSGDGCQANCVEPFCGDDIKDPGEECDDGGNIDGDGCSALCFFPYCGDNVTDPGEECDDGNTNSDDGCSAGCLTEFCGDGVTQPGTGEQCDRGSENSDTLSLACRESCLYAGCGDGVLDRPSEFVTDNGFENWSGVVPLDWFRSTAGGVLTETTTEQRSGNSAVQLNRLISGTLRVHQNFGGLDPGSEYELRGWAKVNAGADLSEVPLVILQNFSRAEWLQGTGIWDTVQGAGTQRGGLTASGVWQEFAIRFTPSLEFDEADIYKLSLWHGNNFDNNVVVFYDDVTIQGPLELGISEECDDGNLNDGDTCDVNCLIEDCGNGRKESNEACDDGNVTAGDGCNSDCVEEYCGDGVLQAAIGEACDSGEANSDEAPNACRTDCSLPSCGDGVVDDLEECDDGNKTFGDGCSAACVVEFCGDGVHQPGLGEECDEGGANSNTEADKCRVGCVLPFCGDDVQDSSEGCDDGNNDNGDGCQFNCQLPSCGDGVLDPGTEECDDGNNTGGDGCSATCLTVVSDDFNACVLDPRWTFVDPVGDASARLIGAGTSDAQLEITVPGGTTHDAWEPQNRSARLMQEVDDDQDMVLETRFGSSVSMGNQIQGILVEQDSNHWVRFDIYSNGTQHRAFAASVINGDAITKINTLIAGGASPAPQYLRVTRAGSNWSLHHSIDGDNWVLAGSFNDTLVVNQAGVFAGNAVTAPEHVALFDYFFETSTPIDPEDGGAVGTGYTLDLQTVVGTGVVELPVPNQTLYFCDAEVSITATPAPGWIFDGWTGSLVSTDNPATVVMDANKSITANFSISLGPPVISFPVCVPTDVSVTCTWTTNEPADSRVDYGLLAPPVDGSESDTSLVTSHSITIFGLTPETEYFFTITSDDQIDGPTTTSGSFTTTAFIPGPFASDDFSSCSLAGQWIFVDPLGDSSFSLSGGGTADASLSITVPGGPAHDPFNGNNSARLMQPAQDTDFQAVVKFESGVGLANQEQGIIVEQDASNWLRFDFVSTGSVYKAFSARVLNGSATTRINTTIASGASPGELYLRVTRTGDDWSLEYCTAGSPACDDFVSGPWVVATTTDAIPATFYTHPLNVSSIGVFAGNAGAPAPAHTAKVDYFFEALAPTVPEDPLAAGSGKILTLSTSGTGSGTITPIPEGEETGTTGETEYYCDEEVTLTASADSGSVFFEWSGGSLAGPTNPQSLTMSADHTVDAQFDENIDPPVISNVQKDVDDVSATITWDTNEPATSRVDYGLAAADEDFEESLTLVTSHSVTLTGLTANTTYVFTITSADSDPQSTMTAPDTFTTNLFPSGAFDSDDFNVCAVNPGRWNFINPLGDASFFTSGAGSGEASVSIVVPGGTSHDPWLANNAPRLMQVADDEDFEVTVKFISPVTTGTQQQGLIIEQDGANWLRFDLRHNGTETKAFAGKIVGGTPGVEINLGVSAATDHIRVTRTGDDFTLATSTNGSDWDGQGLPINYPMTVSAVGIFGGNFGSGASAPAHTAEFDYFELTTVPILAEDAGAAPDGNVLSLSVVGNGQIDVDPDQDSYCSGDVTLTAVEDPGWFFAAWSGGALTGNFSPETLSMTQSWSVTATFTPPTGCGDGSVDPPEECDDGNNEAGDGCSTVCALEVCGNGTMDPGEACDDGNATSGDGCSPLCVLEFCGDGIVQAGLDEECDLGLGTNSDVDPNTCRTSCLDPFCGDNVQDNGEACDDGNNVDGDGCRANCTLPSDASVLAYPFSQASGSTIIDATGHGNDGTLFSPAVRTVEGKYGGAVSFNGSSGRIEMGNLDIPGPELTIAMWINITAFNADARMITKATTDAAQDHYWMLSTLNEKLRFRLKTDDGIGTTSLFPATTTLPIGTWVHIAATYDGAQMVLYQDGDVLTSTAKTGNIVQAPTVPAWIGAHTQGTKFFNGLIDEVNIRNVALTETEIEQLMLISADCGNAVFDFGEDCDDGNHVDGDGCDRFCVLEICGDGIVNNSGQEECDDPSGNDDEAVDGCRTNCLLHYCGDDVQDSDEACDDGNQVDRDGCSSACVVETEYCGDGVLIGQEAFEECDDGNAVDGDGCDTNCTLTTCGNEITTGIEECDDGNLIDGDGCDSNCTVTACGNGITTGIEVCDDGNTSGEDSCSPDCLCAGVVDCAGVCNGTAEVDCAGVCEGTAVEDCAGVCEGTAALDCAGVCGGTSVVDCLGVCGGPAELDCAGVCEGTAVEDCAGVCEGTAVVDCLGVCGGPAELDCAGVCEGTAVEDCAGVCEGTAVVDCAGVCGGTAELDCAGVCGGTAVEDCAGVCGGTAVEDCAGVCEGTALEDCAGVCGGTAVVDCAGVCGGTAELDCAGVCEGSAVEDCAGVCEGTAVLDCAGVCEGTAVVDCAGACGGTAVVDCLGVCGGPAELDCAGVCEGSAVEDCAGVCEGTAVVDCLGVCGGPAELDCTGVCEGTAVEDCAGVCDGTAVEDCAGVCEGTAVEDCAGICEGTAVVDCAGVCEGTAVVDCTGACGGTAVVDCLGVCGGPAELDCAGVCDGTAVEDCAGVCEGTAVEDCAGVCEGTAVVDCAGACGGTAVVDCLGVCGGTAELDCTGVCEGTAVEDCAGVCGGTAVEDCAGVCEGTAVEDCAGVCEGTAVEDCAGVCEGTAVVDCAGACGGTAVVDCLGVCGGTAELDCAGVCEGTAVEDCAGVCEGTAVEDCAGVCEGTAVVDCAGACGGTAVVDCLEVCGGTAELDCTGVCEGTAVEDCAGVCEGTAVEDCAGVCEGTAVVDCAGACGGTAVVDCLGVCGGTAELDCAGVCEGPAVEDCAGVCEGTAVVDCAGVCEGTAVVDCAGVCEGTAVVDCAGACGGTSVVDCLGVCGGTAELDCAGVCEGTAVEDCAGVCEGTAVEDCAGVCEGTAVVDCAGACGGTAVVDCLGVCGGPAELDCAGVCDGTAVEDCAGVCEGTAVEDCAGVCEGTAVLDCAGVCGGTAVVDCLGVCGGTAVVDCLGVCGGTAALDCAGVCEGTAVEDCAGVCEGTSIEDCAGVCGGTAVNCAVSDDFSTAISCPTTGPWTCVDPVGDSTFASSGLGGPDALLEISVPAGTAHDSWTSGNDVARLMQDVDDEDFEIEVKFESSISEGFQQQGLIIQSSETVWLRMDFFHNGSVWKPFAAKIDPAETSGRKIHINPAGGTAGPMPTPMYLRATRTGTTFKFEYSTTGLEPFTLVDTFMEAMTVSKVGVFAGNQLGTSPAVIPAHTAKIDYFFNNASPIDPEDP